jgi:hypothetical protein
MIIITIIGIILIVFTIKNQVTYSNSCKIIDAIAEYNTIKIKDGEYDSQIPFKFIISYDKSLWNIFDWGYTKMISEENLEKIKEYL